ncbi:carboxypeptidase Y-deficient [Oleoguttula sp. CCFEE 5521]
MAARRSLGGGRVLGSGKGLAPPPPEPLHPPVTGLLSPSESSVSLNSQASSTPASTDHEDLASRVALGEHGTTVAAATSRMVCPICNEEMLNRHIDDNHANLEEEEQDEVKTWFKSQMTKAKKFQPLAVLNQKLRGLEVFESNDEQSLVSHVVTQSHSSGTTSPIPAAPGAISAAVTDTQQNAEELVTRKHWQKASAFDACADPMCGKRLGGGNGQVHCRHCGKLFCEEHTMYQMKLSRSAQHEPVRGVWCRVCETCYKTREGYNDHTGLERNHFDFYKSTRSKTVDKQNLEISRLEFRLTRLTHLLANAAPETTQSTGSLLWSSLAGSKPQLRTLEQSVVTWEDDASVTQCPYCQQKFSQYTFRRHHCRICGRVVCGDPATNCSSEVGLDVDTQKPGVKTAIDIRMCKDCRHTVFSKADFMREATTSPPDQRAYQNLLQFEHGIRLLLPRFQRLLLTLQDPEKPPSTALLADAAKVRKRLTDAFTQYDFAARRVRDLPTESPTQKRLQKAVHQQAAVFLHVHMLPLKSLPKVLRHATSSTKPVNGHPQSALSQVKFNDTLHRPGSSRGSSTSSLAVTALEAQEKELRERMIVLEEQKFMVETMIADANKRRQFDEVSALAGNVEDLSREIDQVQGELAQMDFAGLYAAGDGVVK